MEWSARRWAEWEYQRAKLSAKTYLQVKPLASYPTGPYRPDQWQYYVHPVSLELIEAIMEADIWSPKDGEEGSE